MGAGASAHPASTKYLDELTKPADASDLPDDSAALKAYLHSDAHIKEWVPAIAPHFNAAEGTTPLLVFDVPLELAAAK